MSILDQLARMDLAEYYAVIDATLKAEDMPATMIFLQAMSARYPREAAELLALVSLLDETPEAS